MNKSLSIIPDCTEAHLGRLHRLHQLKQFDENKIRQSLRAVTTMPLPYDLAQWRDQLLTQMSSAVSSPRIIRITRAYINRAERYLLATGPSALAS